MLKQILRNLLFAVLSGAFYALFSFIIKGQVEIDVILGVIGFYFVGTCALCLIAPKLRKITGHDKGNS